MAVVLSGGSAAPLARLALGESDIKILNRPVPSVPGPKRTVAVGKMSAVGAYKSAYGGQDVGAALTAMLSTALAESGRFIVVERETLSQVLTEQELAGGGLTQGSAAPQPGKLTPAQYLVTGTVTEFGAADEGGTVSLGATQGLFGGGLSLNRSSGSVAIDLRLISTLTATVEKAFSVSKPISNTGVGLTTTYKNLALGGSKFWNTPVGRATREALNEAVAAIATGVAGGKWQGQVVELDGGQVYVNAGAASGLKIGDRLQIERVTKVMTDPATGEVLSVKKAALGTIRIDAVEEKISSGSLDGGGAAQPQRGDFVVFAN